MGAKPYTMDDVQAWVEMLWERERLDEMTMARIRATVEECDALKAQVEAARALCRDQLDHGKVEADDLADRILEAMDEAAKCPEDGKPDSRDCDCRLGCVNCNPWLW